MQGTILIVDDARTNRDMLSRRLARLGYETATAQSGLEALRILHEQPIALVLLDLMMPDMSGLEVLERVRQKFSDHQLPVLMVSANTESPQMVRAIDLGANDYLTKPIDFPVLAAKVRRALSSMAPASDLGGAPVLAGRYRLGELLGAGGMGEVFRAADVRLGRDVAVKMIKSDHQNPGEVERLLREARALARVSHPGVVTIHEVATEPRPFLVMELLQGRPLEEVRLDLPPEQALRLMVQVLSALQAVHEAGIVHRDLKPANIMVLGEGQVKLVDFGLARSADEVGRLTMTGQVWGTPYYMSPEQVDPDLGEPSPASDQFAAGVILYELLSGSLPFPGPNLATVTYQIVSKAPVPLLQLCPELDESVCQAVERALAKKPEHRFPSCADFQSVLSLALERLAARE